MCENDPHIISFDLKGERAQVKELSSLRRPDSITVRASTQEPGKYTSYSEHLPKRVFEMILADPEHDAQH